MYKSLFAVSLLLASTALCAETYVGVGFETGSTRVESNSLRTASVDGRRVDLSDSDSGGGLRLLAGVDLNDAWAIEVTAQRAGADNGIDVRLDATRDEEWDASVDGRHFTLAPVYSHPLNERFDLRATAGLLYGDYDIEQSHRIDVEEAPDQTISRSTTGESKFGAMIGLGAVYHTPWKLDVLAEVQHQRTSILSKTLFSLAAVYSF